MKKFMDDDFLLETETAKLLFHKYAKNTPIIDYHCHIDAKEIAEDIRIENITQVWLGGDHYKWRLMRANGVDEKYITGDASDREKFQKWAEILPKAIGNPLYHWSHLELQRYFGYHGVLNGDTAEEVWNKCNAVLQQEDMSARGMILKSNVTHLCTTDDPADSLEWHKKIKADKSFNVQVLPAWRPEAAMKIADKGFATYVRRLAGAAEMDIGSYDDFKAAMIKRLEFFNQMGCRASDHSLDYAMYVPATAAEIEDIFASALAGEDITYEEDLKFKTAFLLFIGREYKRLGWVMQLHYGVKRDNNSKMFKSFGANAGCDCIDSYTPSAQLADLLNGLQEADALPKTILYSLNPIDNAAIGSVMGCFQHGPEAGYIQQGSAWWFNDNKTGITEQLTSLANQGLLGCFVGMLTDSRSFVSYTRHEYFRRILCNLIGNLVENGEYPYDESTLGKLVEDISYNNTKNYFHFA